MERVVNERWQKSEKKVKDVIMNDPSYPETSPFGNLQFILSKKKILQKNSKNMGKSDD